MMLQKETSLESANSPNCILVSLLLWCDGLVFIKIFPVVINVIIYILLHNYPSCLIMLNLTALLIVSIMCRHISSTYSWLLWQCCVVTNWHPFPSIISRVLFKVCLSWRPRETLSGDFSISNFLFPIFRPGTNSDVLLNAYKKHQQSDKMKLCAYQVWSLSHVITILTH